ncbi:DUF4173 domain-containing protein [Hymenobacter taeanensis]|uniref:DUF4173 domain-containing protein n=1 Tax=Hymenobacter taeanensis TaxID=2735321 RepID=A0A6M6BDI5_9BACT|nr:MULTISPECIES: DUF4173 domain-containing protein [Hymenobacter]QJX45888.1 DUF4173 domain-containing protein [Hymenobacter taeanensis]UOQ79734.1 DUF4173 domain-containing protein [Hymenobacter sp. 5414T-23]
MATVTSLAAPGPRPQAHRAKPLALSTLQKLMLPLGAIAFDILFWNQEVGLNLSLYTLLITVVTLLGLPRHAAQWHSVGFWAMLLGTVLSSGLVVWLGSGTARLACVASLVLLLGYRNQPLLRQVAYALLTALGSVTLALPGLLPYLHLPNGGSAGWARTRFYSRVLLLPLVVLGVFHVLFSLGSPQYAELSSQLFATLEEWLGQLLAGISIPHLLFFVLGLLLTAGAIVSVPYHFFLDQESRFGEFVRRQRDRVASLAVRRPDFGLKKFRTLDLRKEYLAALAVFGLVNVLLLVVNALDVRLLWFGFTPRPGFDLTQFVHEGTYVLILSILVAMGIVLWFFRRNLNFYQQGLPTLRWGATIWVLQNIVLVVSVGLRNYYYILHTGLAYKRIGVYGFLLLTLFGLGTVLLKIWQRRSAFSLVRLNGWAAYAVLLLLAAGNWEVWITRYNLQPRFKELDLGFLLNMPERMLPELAAREAVLNGMTRIVVLDGAGRSETQFTPAEAHRLVRQRLERWKAAYPRYHTWQSWTYAEAQAYQQLYGSSTTVAP